MTDFISTNRRAMLRLALLAACGLSLAGASVHAAGMAAQENNRIVAIGGSITEIVYALGGADRLVAVDTTSVHPPEALKTKKSVGYMRALSPEGLVAVRPSMILAIPGAGPDNALAVVKAAGVPFVTIPDAYTGGGIVAKIRAVAEALGADKAGECLANHVSAQLREAKQFVARLGTDGKPARVMFVLSIANGRAMVAGGNTAADGIITLAGARNAIADFDGYKAVNDEAIVAANPDAVLVMRRAGEDIKADTLFAMPAFQRVAAAKARKLIAMDGLYLLGFGPRTAGAVRDLASALYADGAAPAPAEASIADPSCASRS